MSEHAIWPYRGTRRPIPASVMRAHGAANAAAISAWGQASGGARARKIPGGDDGARDVSFVHCNGLPAIGCKAEGANDGRAVPARSITVQSAQYSVAGSAGFAGVASCPSPLSAPANAATEPTIDPGENR
jgi:hypothetical protein